MALKIEQVQLALPFASSTVDFVVSGFGTVKAALIITSKANSPNSIAIDGDIGFGFIENTGGFNQRSGSMSSEDGLTQSNEYRALNVSGVYMADDSGGVSAQWTASLITDGVKLTKVAATRNYGVTVILFGGDGLVSVAPAHDTNLDTDSSPHEVTGLGFKPNLIFGVTSATNGATAGVFDSALCIGIAGNHAALDSTPPEQFSVAMGMDHGRLDNALLHAARASSGSFLRPVKGSDATDYVNVVMDSFNADGFTYSWSGGVQVEQCYMLALEVEYPQGIYIGDGTIGSSATAWASDSANSPPIFGMGVGIDGVTVKDTTATDVGALQISTLTTDDAFSMSASADPDGSGTVTVAKSVRGKVGSSWEVLEKDGTSITGTLSFNASNQIDLASMTGVPARTTYMSYLMLSENTNLRSGTNIVPKVYSGTDIVSKVYSGTDQVY
jgi:hypothetical protein